MRIEGERAPVPAPRGRPVAEAGLDPAAMEALERIRIACLAARADALPGRLDVAHALGQLGPEELAQLLDLATGLGIGGGIGGALLAKTMEPDADVVRLDP